MRFSQQCSNLGGVWAVNQDSFKLKMEKKAHALEIHNTSHDLYLGCLQAIRNIISAQIRTLFGVVSPYELLDAPLHYAFF